MSVWGNPVALGGGGGTANIQALSVTQNGTYTASGGVDGYSPVTVSVSGGGGGASVLSGLLAPTAAQGDDGALYLQYGGTYSIQDLVTSESALSVAVSANSFWPGWEPWKAFSSSSSTGWIGHGGDPHWFQVETQTEVPIKSISFRSIDSNRSHAISRVGYSDDGITFTDAALSSSTMVNNQGHTELSQGATGKYFRLYFDGSYGISYYPMISALQIMAVGGSLISAAYAKVSGAWQALIGTDINDIDLGS